MKYFIRGLIGLLIFPFLFIFFYLLKPLGWIQRIGGCQECDTLDNKVADLLWKMTYGYRNI